MFPLNGSRFVNTRQSRFVRRRGVAAVEFAIIAPLLILLLAGMVVWGGWLWLAHGVQSLAAESARAALGGLDAGERSDLARMFVQGRAEAAIGLPADRAAVFVDSDASAIVVRIRYDVSGHPVLLLASLAPAPPMIIERSAVVRTGGY